MTHALARLAAVLLAAPVLAQATQPAASPGDALKLAIARAHGYDAWPSVTRLAFTFHVETADRRVERAWTWEPRTHAVTLTENGATTTFTHGPDVPETDQAADRKFINDTYWLIFPFYLVWADCEITEPVEVPHPLSIHDDVGPLSKVTVKFPDGGYTPGDHYDLFLDEDLLIRGWTFRRGGKPGGQVLPFTDHVTQHGITMALDHRRPDGGFRLWFTDVEIATDP